MNHIKKKKKREKKKTKEAKTKKENICPELFRTDAAAVRVPRLFYGVTLKLLREFYRLLDSPFVQGIVLSRAFYNKIDDVCDGRASPILFQ